MDITVTGAGGTAPTSSADQFTYSNTTWFRPPHDSPPSRYRAPRPTTRPPARRSCSAAPTAAPYYNDTWAWNGANWATAQPGHQPFARGAHHRLRPATEPAGPLRGLQRHHDLNDTWAWTGTNWARPSRRPRAPRPASWPPWPTTRHLASCSLFGGQQQWRPPSTTPGCGTAPTGPPTPRPAPRLRWDVTMAYDPATPSSSCSAATAAAAATATPGPGTAPLAQLTRRPVRAPAGRRRMAYDTATTQLLLFGGYNGAYLSDTWAWNGTTWGQLPRRPPLRRATRPWPTTAPPARWSCSAAAPAATYQRHLDHRRPAVTGRQPRPVGPDGRGHLGHHHRHRLHRRSGAPAAVMFGSTAATHYTVISSTSITASVPGRVAPAPSTSPSPGERRHQPRRPGPTSTPTPTRPGTRPRRPPARQRSWTPSRPTTRPRARRSCSAATTAALVTTPGPGTAPTGPRSPRHQPCRPATAPTHGLRPGHRGELVLFGGDNGSAYYNDTWAWNGTTWTSAIPATWLYHDVHDQPVGPLRGVHGLRPGQRRPAGPLRRLQRHYLNDTWAWNGTSWAKLTPTDQPRRPATGPSMAYDPANGGQLVLFGGYNGSTLRRHLDLERPPGPS